MILAGDVGGTKTALALFVASPAELRPVAEATYASGSAPGLEPLLRHFLADHGAPAVTAACFGVAGPVLDGRTTPTNLPWTIDARVLAAVIPGARVRLVNDLEATAWGILALGPGDLAVLQPGRAHGGNLAVIAAGTGLGEALIVRDGPRHVVVATEGGHADFAPRGPRQAALLAFLEAEVGQVSVERVLSGPGLVNLYRFARATRNATEPAWLTARLASGDPAAVIFEAALSGADAACVEAVEVFVAIYGAEAANLALKGLALGGVYVAGGIAPRIRARLEDGAFVRAFRDKGRFAALMGDIAVRLVLEPRAALLGAARLAARTLSPTADPPAQ